MQARLNKCFTYRLSVRWASSYKALEAKLTKFLLVLFFLIAVCSEEKGMKARNSPCDFSLHFFKNPKKAEYFDFVACVEKHFPKGSDPTVIDKILVLEGFSEVNISTDNPLNYILSHNTLSNNKTQILVFLNKSRMIDKIDVKSGFKFTKNGEE